MKVYLLYFTIIRHKASINFFDEADWNFRWCYWLSLHIIPTLNWSTVPRHSNSYRCQCATRIHSIWLFWVADRLMTVCIIHKSHFVNNCLPLLEEIKLLSQHNNILVSRKKIVFLANYQHFCGRMHVTMIGICSCQC